MASGLHVIVAFAPEKAEREMGTEPMPLVALSVEMAAAPAWAPAAVMLVVVRLG